jgi:hypothetical protein
MSKPTLFGMETVTNLDLQRAKGMKKTAQKRQSSAASRKRAAAPKSKGKEQAKKSGASSKGPQKRKTAAKTYFDLPCHFCGEDHHPSHCDVQMCMDCHEFASKCKCSEPWLGTGSELYENIAAELWEQIPEDAANEIEARIKDDGLLKTVEYAIKKYPETGLKFLAQLVKGSKRQPEAETNQYGNCFGHAFSTMLGIEPYNGVLEQFMPTTDSVRVVHGCLTTMRPNGERCRIGHAWLEFTSKRKKCVLDCGTTEFTPKLWEAKEYYSAFQVVSAECHRYAKDEAYTHFNEKNTWGPWKEPPKDAKIVGYKRKK